MTHDLTEMGDPFPLPITSVRDEVAGIHVHVTFWLNHGNAGTLTMRQEEWQQLSSILKSLTRLREIERLAAQMIKEPDSLCYPERDVYNEHNVEDVNAPLWTECGLYGRVGKEAARTLLSRYKQLHTFLDTTGTL